MKNKKITNTILSLIVVADSTIAGHAAQQKPVEHEQINPQQKQVQSIKQQKSIGIKTKRGNMTMTKNNKKNINGKPMRVGATAYCGDTITSTGTVPKVGVTIAVDPKIIPYGTKVYIPQFDKVFIAEDCGSAIKGNRIDIFMKDYKTCIEWGFKDITIYILND